MCAHTWLVLVTDFLLKSIACMTATSLIDTCFKDNFLVGLAIVNVLSSVVLLTATRGEGEDSEGAEAALATVEAEGEKAKEEISVVLAEDFDSFLRMERGIGLYTPPPRMGSTGSSSSSPTIGATSDVGAASCDMLTNELRFTSCLLLLLRGRAVWCSSMALSQSDGSSIV